MPDNITTTVSLYYGKPNIYKDPMIGLDFRVGRSAAWVSDKGELVSKSGIVAPDAKKALASSKMKYKLTGVDATVELASEIVLKLVKDEHKFAMASASPQLIKIH
jgi:hypothetical protein